MELETTDNHESGLRSKHFIFLLFYSILSLSSFSQTNNPVTKRIVEQYRSLAQNSPSELAYIQTSKGIYETGEDLWFKAYLLDAQNFTPSALSKTLYLQVINEHTKQEFWQEKYEIKNGFADGHVFLPDSLSEGDYLLAAYTEHSFFGDSTELKSIRKIKVRKDMKPRPNVPVQDKKSEAIQFTTFPEGGNMVAGIKSKLAFKAVNPDGMPIDVKGTLYEDGTSLLEFKSLHAGMGSLEFTPLAGKKYNIRLSEPATDSIFLVPEIYPEGISMHLTGRNKDNLEFTIQQSPGLKEQTVYLRVQIRGMIYCMATGILDKEVKIEIPMEKFHFQGITEFTLFNEGLIPVAERLVYVDPDKKLYIETKLDKKKYETREKATLKINVKDENGQPVMANLGVSVYDKLYQNQQDPENILTYYFLSTQLKGKIYDPAFYFDSKNKYREEALDLLLLTQGWRRYVWSETTLTEYSNPKQPIVFDGIKGEFDITKKRKKTASARLVVNVFDPEKDKTADVIVADSIGKFTVTSTILKAWQGGYVYLRPFSPPVNKPNSLTDPFQTINQIRANKEIAYPQPNQTDTVKVEQVRLYVAGPGKMIQLDELTVKGSSIKPFRDKYLGHLDSLAKLNLCKDYVATCGGLNCPFHTFDQSKKPVEGKEYRILTEYDVSNNTFTKSELIIYHYPKLTDEELLRINNLWRVKAYYVEREFYQPNYDKITENYFIPDSRNTLLWAPSVTTNEKGEATVAFFCSDINTGFIGKIDGVSSKGLLGSQGFEFNVLKIQSFKPIRLDK